MAEPAGLVEQSSEQMEQSHRESRPELQQVESHRPLSLILIRFQSVLPEEPMRNFPFGMAALLLMSAFFCVPMLGWGAVVAIIIAIVLAACILAQL